MLGHRAVVATRLTTPVPEHANQQFKQAGVWGPIISFVVGEEGGGQVGQLALTLSSYFHNLQLMACQATGCVAVDAVDVACELAHYHVAFTCSLHPIPCAGLGSAPKPEPQMSHCLMHGALPVLQCGAWCLEPCLCDIVLPRALHCQGK